MAGYWLKPFGTSRPPQPLPDRWTDRLPIEGFPLMTGPARPESPPPIARGDRVLCHAVGHVRLFAAARVLTDPVFEPESRWGPRWPWILRAQVELSVPVISLGPRTPAVLPNRVIGRIQRGSLQVALSEPEFDAAFEALRSAAAGLCPAGGGSMILGDSRGELRGTRVGSKGLRASFPRGRG